MRVINCGNYNLWKLQTMKKDFFKRFNNSKAFSLLEMLVALGLFSFLFLFITQIVRQNHRQVTKIKEDLKLTDSIYHIVNLIKLDLSSSTYFLDLSYNFRTHFPLKTEESDLKSSQSLAQQEGLTGRSSGEKNILLDSEVIFKGTNQDMEFVSYSFSRSNNSKQWMKIRYAVEDCPSGACLMRYERPDWNLYEKLEWEELALVVIEGLESIEFLYSDNYNLAEPEWLEEWEVEAKSLQKDSLGFSRESPDELPLPARVQIHLKKKDSSLDIWTFPISQIRFKEWSPYLKALRTFKTWTPPKESDPNSRKNNRPGSPTQPPTSPNLVPNQLGLGTRPSSSSQSVRFKTPSSATTN